MFVKIVGVCGPFVNRTLRVNLLRIVNDTRDVKSIVAVCVASKRPSSVLICPTVVEEIPEAILRRRVFSDTNVA